MFFMKDNYIKHLQGRNFPQEKIDLVMQSSDMKTFIFIVVFTIIFSLVGTYIGRKIYSKTLKKQDYNMLKLDIRVKILVLILANILMFKNDDFKFTSSYCCIIYAISRCKF